MNLFVFLHEHERTHTYHGVNDVLVSGITFRGNFHTKVRELNNSIQSKESMYDFKFIDNTNILRSDMY